MGEVKARKQQAIGSLPPPQPTPALRAGEGVQLPPPPRPSPALRAREGVEMHLQFFNRRGSFLAFHGAARARNAQWTFINYRRHILEDLLGKLAVSGYGSNVLAAILRRDPP